MSIILDKPEAEYHAHPALSSTGARLLLKSPATFRYRATHPQAPKSEFDLGTAVHSKVLGKGALTVSIPEELLASNGATSTKVAKEFIEKERAAGRTPVKQAVADLVNEMAEAILDNPEARALLEQEGDPEASVFATDPTTGVELRCRFDFLPSFAQTNPIAVDLKTSGKNADPESFSKTIADFGYDVQHEHYLHTHALIGDPSMRMKFIVTETEPPFHVGVYSLSEEFIEIGAARARRAREIYAQCMASGEWPKWDHHPLPLQPPLWHIYQNQELLSA